MCRREEPRILGGLPGLYESLRFAPNAQTTETGTNGGTAMGFLPDGIHRLFLIKVMIK